MTRRDDDINRGERALFLPGEADSAAMDWPPDRWAVRLANLCDCIPTEPPAPGLFSHIEARIDLENTARALAAARRSLRRWQGAAVLCGSLAASLAAVVVMPLVTDPPPPGPVAVVTADEDPAAAGMIVALSPERGWATVVPLVGSVEGQAYEMWHLPEGAKRPQSIGLLPERGAAAIAVSAGPGDLFAISLEAPGGSVTGQPTRPLFHGRAAFVNYVE